MKLQDTHHALWRKQWLVIYTRPRWEKKVERLLQLQGIESYCPLRKVMNQWADRIKQVDLPLFSSYVFVRINERDAYKVRQTIGVMNFVYYMAKPAVIKDQVIEKIREYSQNCPDVEVLSLQGINSGDRVRVKQGLFSDQDGTVIRVQGKNVILVFDHLNCVLVSNFPVSNVVLNTIHTGPISYN
ncbi:UpxY family transcription antiterminator [Pedobacter sp. PLR]|uniref:UpxY family transcription antiterminator n=1 Tax=Pedobacter sp. PLR TaxID=2994465 RepID=UPI0022454B2A|nr:UpxY family transcription antiterminator [Pedobacter sp. PLR]MCX2452207.1 UpxY family transcription antiterminator [Pedobacter sp. PLR]